MRRQSMKEISSRIREIRKILGITQRDVATSVGINPLKVTRFEQGGGISADTLVDILGWVGGYVDLNIIFDESKYERAIRNPDLLLSGKGYEEFTIERVQEAASEADRELSRLKEELDCCLDNTRRNLRRKIEISLGITQHTAQ